MGEGGAVISGGAPPKRSPPKSMGAPPKYHGGGTPVCPPLPQISREGGTQFWGGSPNFGPFFVYRISIFVRPGGGTRPYGGGGTHLLPPSPPMRYKGGVGGGPWV